MRIRTGALWLQWTMLLVVLVVLTYAGITRLHVREFSLFLLIVLGAAATLVALLASSRQPK